MNNDLILSRKIIFEDKTFIDHSQGIEYKLIQKRKLMIDKQIFDLKLKDLKRLLREKELNLFENFPLDLQNFQIINLV